MNIEPSRLEMLLTKIVMHTPAKKIYQYFADQITIKGNEKVLDFGSGYGTVAKFIAKRLSNGELTCVDISHKWQKRCKKYLRHFKNIYYYNDDLYTLNETETFDIAYAHFVLHDIPNQELEKIIPHLYKLLKPNGKLYIREPLEDSNKIDYLETLLKQSSFIENSKKHITIMLMGGTIDSIFQKNSLPK